MTKFDKKFFEVARGVSQLSDFSRTKVRCIVVDGKRILSSGYNSNKTNPTQQRYNYYRNIDVRFPAKVHAEVSALNSLINKKEIDFVAIKRSEKLYIQVSDDISSDKTFEREISPLLSIGDAYPKMILARTHHETTDRDGVQIVDLVRWLAGEA